MLFVIMAEGRVTLYTQLIPSVDTYVFGHIKPCPLPTRRSNLSLTPLAGFSGAWCMCKKHVTGE